MALSNSVVVGLKAVDKADKWLVSGTVFLLVVRHWGVAAMWALLGALLNAIVCKVTKKLLNQPRPGTAEKVDPGMPSSHACSLMFLSVYAACLFWTHGETNVYAAAVGVSGTIAAAAMLSLGALLSSLRYMFGHHTIAQVAVGAALGITDSFLW